MAAVLLFFPLGVLFVSFVAVCLHAGTVWPWMRVVHEDGQRTLLGTIFYFEHAVRELPLDLILGAAVAGSFRYFYPLGPAAAPGVSAPGRRLSRCFAWVTVLTIGVIAGGAAIAVGIPATLDNLAQMHTRPGAALIFGLHWRYHLLERLALIFFAFAAVGVCWRFASPSPNRGSPALYAASLAIFVLFTLLFRLSYEPFENPVFLGHQARELFTHLTVTLPLAFAACARAAGLRFTTGLRRSWTSGGKWAVYGTAASGTSIGLYLVIGSLLTGARSQAQTDSIVPLIFAHYFEHSLTYVVTPLAAVALYVWGREK